MDIFDKISPLQEEMSRLQTQAEEFAGFVAGALQKLELSQGMSAADIGCGTGHVAFALSHLVGPEGRITGLDANPTAVEFCRKEAEEKKVRNAQFVIGDAQRTGFESGRFDAVFSRFLLQHVKEPGGALKEMIRITRPGGTVMIEDCDLQFWAVEPEDKYVKQLWTWYESVIRQKGSDPAIGRKLYSMFVQNGLKPQIEIYSLPVVWENRKIWDGIVSVLRKIGSSSESEVIEGIENFKQKKDALFVFPLVFRVWAKVR